MQTQHVSVPKLTYSLAEAELASGLSRASLYRAIAAGKLTTVKHGKRRLVPVRALEDFLQSPDEDDLHAPVVGALEAREQ